jgi:hypothetical protein
MIPKQKLKWFTLHYEQYILGAPRDNILNAFQVNQNYMARICLNKCTLQGSTNQNYKRLGILSVRFL